jgi:hypothetical protein
LLAFVLALVADPPGALELLIGGTVLLIVNVVLAFRWVPHPSRTVEPGRR